MCFVRYDVPAQGSGESFLACFPIVRPMPAPSAMQTPIHRPMSPVSAPMTAPTAAPKAAPMAMDFSPFMTIGPDQRAITTRSCSMLPSRSSARST